MRVMPNGHRDYQIEEEVWFDNGGKKVTGRITGVANVASGVYFYIVTLDEPIDMSSEGWRHPWRTVALPGGFLRSKLDIMK